MRKLILIQRLALFMILSNSLFAKCEIIIRLAQKTDLPAIIDLDRQVSYKDFIPLIPQYYTDFFTQQQYIDRLEYEMNELDPEMFEKGIDQVEHNYLHVAIDQDAGALVGFNSSIKNGKILELGFGAVAKGSRCQGIYTKLIQAAIGLFDDLELVNNWPLQHNLIACRALEKAGFKNMGPGPADKLNCFGFGWDKWNYLYQLDLTRLRNE